VRKDADVTTSSPLTGGVGLPIPPDDEGGSQPSTRRGDRVFAGLSRGAGILILLALAGVFVFLAVEGIPGISQPVSNYAPKDNFWTYVGNLLFGTVYAAVIALLIAVPFSIGVALFIAIYAPRRIAAPVAYVIDLLAAVPSVIFGIWGAFTLAKHVTPIYEWLYAHFSWLPFFAGPPSATGRTMLTAGLVLAIMIMPIITAISREIFAQTPRLHREAAMALGATKWEMVRLTVFPYARSGVVSAVMLGLGRALGETMAVAIVLSASPLITLNLISTDNPTTIAANIATSFAEATPEKLHVLIATGLALFALTFVVNFAARAIVERADRQVSR
jgi:phosphate transport system permease protein